MVRTMKRFFSLGLAVAMLALVSACESGKPKKPKPVPPTANVDAKPWNRPHSWENNSRFGGMMPQSR